MLNFGLKKEAIAALEQVQASYDSLCQKVKRKADELYEVRRASSEQLICAVEKYINELANSPKEFDKTFSEYRAEFSVFTDHVREIEAYARKSNIQAAGVAALYVFNIAPMLLRVSAPGLAVALPPGAVSFISPAAMLLGGPAGLVAGLAPLVAGGFSVRRSNTKVAEEAVARRKELEALNRALNIALTELMLMLTLTKDHVEGVEKFFTKVRVYAPRDYSQFDDDQRQQMGALINHVHSLSVLLNKQVEVGEQGAVGTTTAKQLSTAGVATASAGLGSGVGSITADAALFNKKGDSE